MIFYHIAYYTYRLTPSSRLRRSYVRDECAENTEREATQFDTLEVAEDRADEIRANSIARWPDIRFTFVQRSR